MKKWCRILLFPAVLCLLGTLLILSRNSLPGWEPPEELPASLRRRVQNEILQAAQVLAESSPEVDAMEEALIQAGFATLDTDEVYPKYLANSDGLYAFWDAVSAGKDASQSVLRVSGDTGFHHLLFLRNGEEDLFFLTEVDLSHEGEPSVRECTVLPIYDMELADWDIFYYRVYPAGDPHYIDYSQLRLKPADREAYDLNRKYILPIGYQMVNLFLTNWQEQDWGSLSFNDLLESLYTVRTGNALDWEPYLTQSSPTRAMIPADVFESAVLPYFQISLEEFRELSQYDPETGTYPWRPIHGNDLTTWKYPMCEPEVTDWTENSDGTLTLTVQVYSPELKTDRLFIHALTLRPLADGGFQYVSNRVTYVSGRGLPPSMARFSLD